MRIFIRRKKIEEEIKLMRQKDRSKSVHEKYYSVPSRPRTFISRIGLSIFSMHKIVRVRKWRYYKCMNLKLKLKVIQVAVTFF